MSIYAPKKPKRINTVSVTTTLVLAALIYAGWWYLPHWFKVWQMSSAMITIGRKAYREYDDEKLFTELRTHAARIGLRVTRDNFAIWREPFTAEELSGLTAEARDLYTKRGKKIYISFAYNVDAQWPLIEKTTPLSFDREREVDLAVGKW